MKENRELTQPDEEYSLAERVPLACNNQHDCNRSLFFYEKWQTSHNFSYLYFAISHKEKPLETFSLRTFYSICHL